MAIAHVRTFLVLYHRPATISYLSTLQFKLDIALCRSLKHNHTNIARSSSIMHFGFDNPVKKLYESRARYIAVNFNISLNPDELTEICINKFLLSQNDRWQDMLAKLLVLKI